MGVGDGGWFGGEDCGGSRARLLGTGPVSVYGVTFLRGHDGGGVRGCWWGMVVVVVAAPVSWVPAYAGKTVRGEGVLVGDGEMWRVCAPPIPTMDTASGCGKTVGG